ncbi:MAG TPA: FHA domain-containing protein, partial [Bdellovibrionales bacterium]|nr:FHA domain-containing protein [Bdellovibrionales bacterium]
MSVAAAAQLPQPLYVTIVAGPDRGVAFKVLSARITLGREEDNDIQLNDPRCSRHHAVIETVNGVVYIKDKGSQNGLVVNGQNCREAQLRPGDVFAMGDTQFQIQTNLGAVPAATGPTNRAANPYPPTMPAGEERNNTPLIIGLVV